MPRTRKHTQHVQTTLFRASLPPKEAFRDVRNFLAGQFVGATRDDALLDEVLKCLFCKFFIERGSAEKRTLSTDPFVLAKQARSIFANVRAEFPDIYEPDTEILLDPVALAYVLNSLNFTVMDASSDPIGDAFEAFIGSESKGNAGQFFTPRSVTSLLVAAVDPKAGERLYSIRHVAQEDFSLPFVLTLPRMACRHLRSHPKYPKTSMA